MMRQVLDVLGLDRIMFAVDDPFNSTLGQQGKGRQLHSSQGFARTFIETAPISDEGKSKMAHRNADQLLLARAQWPLTSKPSKTAPRRQKKTRGKPIRSRIGESEQRPKMVTKIF